MKGNGRGRPEGLPGRSQSKNARMVFRSLLGAFLGSALLYPGPEGLLLSSRRCLGFGINRVCW